MSPQVLAIGMTVIVLSMLVAGFALSLSYDITKALANQYAGNQPRHKKIRIAKARHRLRIYHLYWRAYGVLVFLTIIALLGSIAYVY